jgi:CPA1 family monovalent cation:H+ antiporter
MIRLPHTMGLLIMDLGASLVLIAIDLAFPTSRHEDLTATIRQIEFSRDSPRRRNLAAMYD